MVTGAQLDISYLVRSSVNKRPLNIGLYLDRNVVTMQETEIHCSSPQGTFEKLTVYLHFLKPRCSLHRLFNSQFGKATHTHQHRPYWHSLPDEIHFIPHYNTQTGDRWLAPWPLHYTTTLDRWERKRDHWTTPDRWCPIPWLMAPTIHTHTHTYTHRTYTCLPLGIM